MTDERSIWELMFEGRYLEALPLLEREDSGDNLNLSIVLLALGRPQEALVAARNFRADTSGHFEMVGLCHWLQGESDKALLAWKSAQNSRYTDAAGGVRPPALCYYGAIRMGDEKQRELALKSLRKFRTRTVPWPAPVAGFLLGDYPEAEFSWQENFLPTTLEERYSVQANFWKGVRCLSGDEPEKAKAHFQRAYQPKGRGILEIEHFLARHELLEGSFGVGDR